MCHPGRVNVNRGLCAVLLLVSALVACQGPRRPYPKPSGHDLRRIHGWTVRVDRRLIDVDGEAGSTVGPKALALLEQELKFISERLPEDPVRKLRAIPIWLDEAHGGLKGEMYHPDRDWLVEHRYDPSLWRGIQVPRAADFCDPARRRTEPMPLLHQLIHGFQDRAFGFDDPRIVAGYERFKARHPGAEVSLPSGRTGPHPALKRPREYFLEMSLAYFNLGRVPPKTAEELRRQDPEAYHLIESCWKRGMPD